MLHIIRSRLLHTFFWDLLYQRMRGTLTSMEITCCSEMTQWTFTILMTQANNYALAVGSNFSSYQTAILYTCLTSVPCIASHTNYTGKHVAKKKLRYLITRTFTTSQAYAQNDSGQNRIAVLLNFYNIWVRGNVVVLRDYMFPLLRLCTGVFWNIGWNWCERYSTAAGGRASTANRYVMATSA